MNEFTTFPTLIFCAVLLSACTTDDPSEEQTGDDLGSLAWSSCPENEALDCATLSVPMDYNNVDAGEIEIALNRLPAATQPASGVLLVNPGGPGTGLDMTELLAEYDILPEAVRERYDTIGFDPRGFGQSTPLDCELPENLTSTDYLVNAEMIGTFVEESTQIAESCHTQLGDYLLQLGSMNVVRDMESIRQALDVEEINFVGLSYGTRLAALYLQHYPDTSGAFVLDASESPDSSLLTSSSDVLPKLEENLQNMLMQCPEVEPDCSPDELQQSLIDTMNTLAADGDQLMLPQLLELISMVSEDPDLAEMAIAPLVSYLLHDDISGLLTLAEMLASEDDDEDEVEEDNEDETGEDELNFSIAQRAVVCADDAFRPTQTDLLGYLESFNSVSDFFAENYIQVAGLCTGWPQSPDALPLIATGTAPMSLVIGGTSDTTAALAWSQEMATSIGGYFLASSHEGHTTVYQDSSECVDDIVTEFLVDGLLPTAGDCLTEETD